MVRSFSEYIYTGKINTNEAARDKDDKERKKYFW